MEKKDTKLEKRAKKNSNNNLPFHCMEGKEELEGQSTRTYYVRDLLEFRYKSELKTMGTLYAYHTLAYQENSLTFCGKTIQSTYSLTAATLMEFNMMGC